MKSRNLLMTALGTLIVLWLCAPLLAFYPSWVYQNLPTDCNPTVKPALAPASSPAERCTNLMQRQGQSGDLYGAATSLFSGLGLFALAFTMYSDLSYRRRERKPVIVCEPTDSFSFDTPTLENSPKTCYIKGKLSISSLSDSAMNVVIQPILSINGQSFKTRKISLHVPLEMGKIRMHDYSDILSSDAIDALCKSPTQLPKIGIKFSTSCTNLDDEKFASEMSFDLKLRFYDYAKKIMSLRHEGEFAGAWADKAAIDLVATVEENSWKFSPNSSEV